MAEKAINHFIFIKLSDAYWSLPVNDQEAHLTAYLKQFQFEGISTNFYQVSPLRAEVDWMLWNAAPLQNEKGEAEFFHRLVGAINYQRLFFQPVVSLWGYTKPSVYSRAPSSQEIDPFSGRRPTYFILYPFVKTIRWYLLGKDTRQGMMNEHIRIGHQHPEIKQLLLYSFGVQDQEFIVAYETEDLYRFSELVNELRSSDVREYTKRDTPVYSAIWRPVTELVDLYCRKG